MIEPSKRDWKLFCERISVWQESYMEKLVKEYADYLCSNLPASTRFWELEKRIKQDRKHPGVLIELKKSRLFMDIVDLIQLEVITMDDLADFSNELKECVAMLLQRFT